MLIHVKRVYFPALYVSSFNHLLYCHFSAQIDMYSNKIANIFLTKFKLQKGDCVALMLENKPEYVATWIGLSKIGVISALINTNLKSKPLLHSLTLAQPKAIIYGSQLATNMATVVSELNLSQVQLIVDDYDHSRCVFVISILINKTGQFYSKYSAIWVWVWVLGILRHLPKTQTQILKKSHTHTHTQILKKIKSL